MSRIIRRIDRDVVLKTVKRCRERNVVIPTFKQLANPALMPDAVRRRLEGVGLWDVHPVNLFRITWKNDPETGLFGAVNSLELPGELTGVRARIIGLVGKYFPTGAHKVGAAFGCLVPKLVSGEFDPTVHRAVWPSTGNFCRGGAFDCALLSCTAVAVLPAGMSQERFEWLRNIGAEVITTPGCESNVKEIYDKCWELRKDPTNVIFNQFDEFGNPIFHYNVTGPAIQEVFSALQSKIEKRKNEIPLRLAAFVSATGSAGTIAAGDYLKKFHPHMRIVAAEALQCPTLYMNGFGEHRIEGIGDKHVPWVHNVRTTDAVAAIDDEDCVRVFRLFNEPVGVKFLSDLGIPLEEVSRTNECRLRTQVRPDRHAGSSILSLLGISGVANLLAAIKTAKYFEMDEHDVIFTIFTDSAELYQSRLRELNESRGRYTEQQAARDFERALLGQRTDFYAELGYRDRKRIHNLKYYTWVEQQGKTVEELNEQWTPEYWRALLEDEVVVFDRLIEEFNGLKP